MQRAEGDGSLLTLIDVTDASMPELAQPLLLVFVFVEDVSADHGVTLSKVCEVSPEHIYFLPKNLNEVFLNGALPKTKPLHPSNGINVSSHSGRWLAAAAKKYVTGSGTGDRRKLIPKHSYDTGGEWPILAGVQLQKFTPAKLQDVFTIDGQLDAWGGAFRNVIEGREIQALIYPFSRNSKNEIIRCRLNDEHTSISPHQAGSFADETEKHVVKLKELRAQAEFRNLDSEQIGALTFAIEHLSQHARLAPSLLDAQTNKRSRSEATHNLAATPQTGIPQFISD